MTRKRQLSESEKQEVLTQHERRCFVDGEPIAEEEPIEFHHITPYDMDGPTIVENIAPVCKAHHRLIGTMSLQEFRDKIDLARFFEDGSPKYLDDLIRYKGMDFGKNVTYEIESQQISLYFLDSRNDFPLYECPTTGWKYFYATLPVEYVKHDSELQPRAIREPSLWKLYRHFQSNTQLSPSIGRIDTDGNVLVFDGQHKIAAQIWGGRSRVECKVYLNPDPRVLKETNLQAHGPFRQMTFFSHELMQKYADIFKEDWAEFMEMEGEKSELQFFNFLVNSKKKTKARARNEIVNAIHKEIVDDPENKLSSYLAEQHRGRKQPLTSARLKKTFLQHMILPPPIEEEFESENDFRKDEERNLVTLMNIVVEEGLEGKWAPDRADSEHKKAERIFSAGAVRAWVILLKDTINVHLRHYSDEGRRKFFFRSLSDEEYDYFRKFIRKIFDHKIWVDPDPAGVLGARLAKDDATTAKSLFDEVGLTVEYVLKI